MRYIIAMNLAMTWARVLLLMLCVALGAVQAQAPTQRPLPASALNLIGEAEQAIAVGNDRQAETLLARIPQGSLDPGQLARIHLVRCEIGLRRRQPDVALRALPPSSAHVPALAARMELLRARAYFMAGDPAAAVRTLVARERGLVSLSAVHDNQDQIWNGLIATPLPARLALRPDEDAVTRGWLELAQVLQQGAAAPALTQWTQRHPSHPGRSRTALVRSAPAAPRGAPGAATAPLAQAAPPLGSYSTPETFTAASPGAYALLLPLSGSLASAGIALREGFVSAWFDSPAPRPELRVYDTGGGRAQAVAAYAQALREGAGFLVGPLTKDALAAIAGQGVSLPWLALNYSANVGDSSFGTAIQFGLAPEDEARAAARSAAAAGQRRALTLVPDNDWGARAAQAFSAAFAEQGGQVVQGARYRQGTQDFGAPLRQLMALDRSTQRHRELTAVLGVPSEFEPRPREDADLLFVPLRAAEAPVLIPQLDFFRTRRLSTYVLSAAHGGSLSTELEGLRVCDAPWVLDSSGRWAGVRERAREQFPDTMAQQPRLFALGADAFRLASALHRGELSGGRELDGATGRLSLQAGGRIARSVECRLVRGGRASL